MAKDMKMQVTPEWLSKHTAQDPEGGDVAGGAWEGPLNAEEEALIDRAWETHKAAEPRKRFNYLSVGEAFNLNHACRMLSGGDFSCYQVGSSLARANYRDVDVRAIMQDAEYDAMFKVQDDEFGQASRARLKLFNVAISEWLAARTGLPIDFQFQRMTEANKEFGGQQRNHLGTFIGQWVEP